MDEGKYRGLMRALAGVPDPRKRRGQRYPWRLLLTLLAAALASDQAHGRAIGQWVREHAADLRERLNWSERRLPSEATLRRALLAVDVAALERQVSQLAQTQPAPTTAGIAAQALDGKVVRGARRFGRRGRAS